MQPGGFPQAGALGGAPMAFGATAPGSAAHPGLHFGAGPPGVGGSMPSSLGAFGATPGYNAAGFGAPGGGKSNYTGASAGFPGAAYGDPAAAVSRGAYGTGAGAYGAAAAGGYGDPSQSYMSAGGVDAYGEEDYSGFDLDWQDQRLAEWQDRIQTEYFSRWSADKLDEWQAYQARFDAAHDGSTAANVQAGPGMAPPQWSQLAAPQVVSEEEKASADAYRRENEMSVISAFSTVPLPVRDFAAANLPPSVYSEIQEAGFVQPTPIQAQCWPVLSAGHDMIGIAKSGSGKTLAFLGPGFSYVLRSAADVQRGPMILVLAPTRELARQIQLEALKFGRSSGILSCAVTGGESKGEQLEWVKRGCHIIVATPGRLNEFLERRHVWLGQVGYAVLDEADRMLDMGFEPQIRRIIDECPKGPERQTLLFSATWPKAVRQLAFEFLRRPLHVHIGEMNSAKANTDVDQRALILDRASDKDQALIDTLTQDLQEKNDLSIVFVATKKGCQDISQRLQVRGFGVAEIHGDKDQRERDNALHSFVNFTKTVLVATDVASRGLDIKGVKLVINYDAANTPEDHVHRIGRTGRAGEKGISYTMLVRGDSSDIRKAQALVEVMQTAGQEVPEDLRQLAGTPTHRGGGKGKRGGGFKDGGRGGKKGSKGLGRGGFKGGGGAKGGAPAPPGGFQGFQGAGLGQAFGQGAAPSLQCAPGAQPGGFAPRGF